MEQSFPINVVFCYALSAFVQFIAQIILFPSAHPQQYSLTLNSVTSQK